MKQTARLWLRIWSVVAAISAAAVGFAAIKGIEPLLAAALVALVISGLMIPVMVKRASVQRRMEDGDGLLAAWEYSPDESERLAAASPWGKRAILRQPCQTRIGKNYLLVANRYHALNDYNRMSAEHARFLPASEGMATLRMRYSFWAGKRYSRHEKDIDIPVPLGREDEARALAERL
jgi:hypothetical protein